MRKLPVENLQGERAPSAVEVEAEAHDLGAESVRLARIAAALHMSQAASLLARPQHAPALWWPHAENGQ